jgi:hypothetical protein
MRFRAVLGGLALAACAGTPPAPARPPPVDEPPTPKRVCPKLDPAAGIEALPRGLRFADHLRIEEHPKAEVWEAGMKDLRTAAENGEVEAQFRFGVTLFGFLFTDHAPQASDEKQYVDALAFVRIAALRGHDRAKKAIPHLADQPLPKELVEQPLSDVPRPWLDKAVKKAKDWLECAPIELRSMPPAPLVTVLEANASGWTKRGDPEGPMLRLIAGRRSSLTNQIVASFPAIYDCYADFLRRGESKTVALGFEIDKTNQAVKVQAGDDPTLSSCVDRVLPMAPDEVSAFRFAIQLTPRALDAKDLPDAGGETIERWEEDKSCWALEQLPPCPKNKSCAGPELIRVRCP